MSGIFSKMVKSRELDTWDIMDGQEGVYRCLCEDFPE